MLTLGCHLSNEGGLLKMAHEAASIDATTFQFFTRNPRGSQAKPLDPTDVAAFEQYAPTVGIKDIMGYASYAMNLVNPDQDKRTFARSEFAEDVARMEHTPGNLYAMHCGSAEGQNAEEACELLVDALNATLTTEQTTRIALVNSSGRGTEIGTSFEQLAKILEGVNLKGRVGVCLDTCNLWNAGYDIVNDLDGVLEQLDKTLGLQNVFAVHLNDSEYGLGSHEGRHAAIGTGTIGFKPLAAVVNSDALHAKPFYLEEPHGTLPEYSKDIKHFRNACERAVRNIPIS